MKRLLIALFLVACGGATPKSPPPPVNVPVPVPVPETPSAPSTEEQSPVPVGEDDPSWGNKTALVTIVEFSDLQCPFCARAESTIARLKEAYGPEKLRVVWKHEPLAFHPQARALAEWSQAVFAISGNQAFFCFVNKAFEGKNRLDAAPFGEWATACGVPNMLVPPARVQEKIERDHALGQKLGVNGTPSFYINGVPLGGAQPYDHFATVIDEQLKLAQLMIDKGVPRQHLYAIASTANYQKPAHEAEDEEPKEDTTTVFKIPVGTSPQRGPAGAPITIVEFSDFQCPFCKRAETTLAQIRQQYGDRVRIVWKDEPLPFHPHAEPAAQLAREARAQKGDAGFWDAHDRLFEKQPALEDSDLDGIATAMSLTLSKVKDAIKTHRHKSLIAADADLADDFGVTGTPQFFINGRRLVGAQPIEKFTKIIDEELAHAADFTARGITPARLYEELTKNGKGAPEPEKRTVASASDAPWKGAAGATITIQEFSDFQCPFCKRVEPTLAEILKAYSGRVKIVWRHLPLPMHPDAPLAAEAAMEAFKQKGNDGFWKMHDILFSHQSEPDALKRDALDEYARGLGLDIGRWNKALDSSAHQGAIDFDAKSAQDAGISGTPAFVINGYYVSGAQPLEKFRRVIDRALADASKH